MVFHHSFVLTGWGTALILLCFTFPSPHRPSRSPSAVLSPACLLILCPVAFSAPVPLPSCPLVSSPPFMFLPLAMSHLSIVSPISIAYSVPSASSPLPVPSLLSPLCHRFLSDPPLWLTPSVSHSLSISPFPALSHIASSVSCPSRIAQTSAVNPSCLS